MSYDEDFYDIDILEDELMHYGTKRHSGRYPWGSGDKPFQRSGDFLSRVEELHKQGFSEKDIAESLELSTGELRIYKQIAKTERDNLRREQIKSLRNDGLNDTEIAKIMGLPGESSVRNLMNVKIKENKNQYMKTADILKEEIEKKRYLDVGAGVELELGVSRTTLEKALAQLETEGYSVRGVGVQQTTNPKQQTTVAVLTKDAVNYKDLYSALKTGEIQSVGDYHSDDGGTTFKKCEYPASIDSSRIFVRYGDKGGSAKDGVIEIRRGVKDLSLGNSHYAQVRILADGTHYLKGMAMYSDDVPDGYDIVFNTNKKTGTPVCGPKDNTVLKNIDTVNPDNPFGADITAAGQSRYLDADGNEKLSAINKLKNEGNWEDMSKNLSQQFLSKQPKKLIEQQLTLTYDGYLQEFEKVKSYTNPTVRKKLLLEFAETCDSAAVHLKAIAFPGQTTQVLLPLNDISDKQCYCPNYKNGTKLALVRYPHAGPYEIPVVTVNNNNEEGKDILGNVKDAIGININVAAQLSGADFDGDQCVCIPISDKAPIHTQKILNGLEGFDPKEKYPPTTTSKRMTKGARNMEMGIVSNLITDMYLRGAPEEDIVRAVKHSMVVIDAYKHELDYKKSEKENGIAELKKKWQQHVTIDGEYKQSGASTLLSLRKQSYRVPETKGSPRIDPETGKKIWKESGRTYVDPKTGKTVDATKEVSLMSYVDDAHKLSTGTIQEELYADYANKMKALANEARKTWAVTPNLEYNKEAAKIYNNEVASLNAKLNTAILNSPKERRATILANSRVTAKSEGKDLSKKDLKKLRSYEINQARYEVGASGKNSRIVFTDKEWEAIQAGAISHTKLTQLLTKADQEQVKQLALPKVTETITPAQEAKIRQMLESGYTYEQVATALGVSKSTVHNYSET